MNLRRMLCVYFAVVICTLGMANAPVEVPLTNTDVIGMHELGLSTEVIIAKIRSTPCSFDVSLEGLKKIHESGISDDVLAEMIRVSSSTSEPIVEQGKQEDQDPNDPSAYHPSGIYVFDDSVSPAQMVKLEPSVYNQTKTGGMFKTAITYGAAKAKTRAVLRGAHSQIQISNSEVIFYFYFSQTDQNLGEAGGFFQNATSANEFILVRMEPGKKKKDKDTRQLLIGKFSMWGAEGGILDESVVPFTHEKIRDGLYKVVPEKPLAFGEYCFLYAAGAPVGTGYSGPIGGGKVYDFGRSSGSK